MTTLKERYSKTKKMPYNYELNSEVYGEAGFIWDLEISALNKPSNVLDKFRVENSIKEYRIYYEKKCKEWGFNEQELKKYKKGEDVYFSYERFKELVNHKSQS